VGDEMLMECFIAADADVDECKEDGAELLCGRSEVCQNTVGSFICRRRIDCGSGYQLDISTSSCIGQYRQQVITHC